MKNIIKLSLILSVAISLFSCKGMTDMYEQYAVPGGRTYPQKPTNPVAHSGENRVVIKWEKGYDPTIVKAIISWGNSESEEEKAKVREFIIDGNNEDIVAYINDLSEQNYSFKIRTYNEDGDASVPVELNSLSYGQAYRESMYNRVLKTAYIKDDKLLVEWGAADITNGMISTEFRYQAEDGQEKVIELAANNNNTFEIDDYQAGTTLKYMSVFQPDTTCIDSFVTDWSEVTPLTTVDRANWIVTADTFEGDHDANPTMGADGRMHYVGGQTGYGGAEPWRIIDNSIEFLHNGNVPTYWHTSHTKTTPFPHWIAIDMQEPINIRSVVLQCRNDANCQSGYSFKNFTIQGSHDGVDWVDLEIYDVYSRMDTSPQYYPVNTKENYSHFRVYMNTGYDVHAHLAELSILAQ